ncbi:hypothetical protein DL769_008926 [Monosporascus sp. CRB-8-3]|nr:hypothetical protein DL769_008926 [Monosporascus sp. CRB-8-3]
MSLPTARSMDQSFRLFDLPVELQVKVMTCLLYNDLNYFISCCRPAARVFASHFPSFVKSAFDDYPHMPDNAEMRHLLYRLLGDMNTKPSSYAWDPTFWHGWLKDFKYRSDAAALPEIPISVGTLLKIRTILDTIEFWMRRFHYHLSFIYKSDDEQVMSTALLVSDKTWHDEHSFSEVESYRIRRALLLFQLYCTLFHQPPDYLHTFFNGRVSEQISFLQSLQTFLVAELDGVYGMIEWIASGDIGVAWILTRKSAPLRPGLGAVPGGAKFEYFMSLGLITMRQFIMPRVRPAEELAAHDYKYREFMRGVMPLQNRFFVTAVSKYWNFRRTGRINTGVDSVPGVIPKRMAEWDQAPEGTNRFSWAFGARDGYEGDENRDGMAFLGNVDVNNWRGLAFWDHDRYERHMSFAEEPRVNRNFSGRYMLATFSPSMRRDWRRFDRPDVGYGPRPNPDSPAALNPAIALTGLPARRQVFAEATAEDIAHWEGYIPPVYEDENGDDEDDEDEENEDGEDGNADNGNDEDGDDEMMA